MYYRFDTTLAAVDAKRHLAHPFDLPPGCTSLRGLLRFTPPTAGGIRNMLTLTLFDPSGFRGAGHRGGDEHAIHISPGSATPGYLPGALPAGPWMAQVDTHMIYGDAPCAYTLELWAESDEVEAGAASITGEPPLFATVARPQAGWYRGDLHAHTFHSDGRWSPRDLVAAARATGLDFVALTDHNTTSSLAEMAVLASPQLLTMGGMELTTFWGHAVYLGNSQWVDWRVDATGTQMAAIAQQAYAAGHLFIVAHPKAVGDPYCTGCRWLYPAMMPGTARLVEVWNGPWQDANEEDGAHNEDALRLWYRWLNAGHRLVATAGSDSHGPLQDQQMRPGFTHVYAQELSQPGILRGVLAGRVYLSVGPTIDLHLHDAGGAQATMGQTLQATAPELAAAITWTHCPRGAQLRLVVNGSVQQQTSIAGTGTLTWTFAAPPLGWCVLEVRSAGGAMLALSNPVHFEPAPDRV